MIKEISNGKTVIVAPHQDDEAIAAAVTMNEAIKGGGELYVVFNTCGAPSDGFKNGEYYPKTKGGMVFNSQKEFAIQRGNESIDALDLIGLPRDSIYFLGIDDSALFRYLNQI